MSFTTDRVEFVDGTNEKFTSIIYATGLKFLILLDV